MKVDNDVNLSLELFWGLDTIICNEERALIEIVTWKEKGQKEATLVKE